MAYPIHHETVNDLPVSPGAEPDHLSLPCTAPPEKHRVTGIRLQGGRRTRGAIGHENPVLFIGPCVHDDRITTTHAACRMANRATGRLGGTGGAVTASGRNVVRRGTGQGWEQEEREHEDSAI